MNKSSKNISEDLKKEQAEIAEAKAQKKKLRRSKEKANRLRAERNVKKC